MLSNQQEYKDKTSANLKAGSKGSAFLAYETFTCLLNIISMDKVTDQLLAGISDSLTDKLELFLLNIDGKDVHLQIIEFINNAYTEGAQSALEYYASEQSDFAKNSKSFMDDFKNLLNGQDKPIS